MIALLKVTTLSSENTCVNRGVIAMKSVNDGKAYYAGESHFSNTEMETWTTLVRESYINPNSIVYGHSYGDLIIPTEEWLEPNMHDNIVVVGAQMLEISNI